MDSEYVLWQTLKPPFVCALGGLEGVPKVFELKDGLSRAADFPEAAYFQMSSTYPYDIRLADTLKNADRLLVASERLGQFLENLGLRGVEFLPVTILNHKGRIASREYRIIHLIDPIDCLDLEKCGATFSALLPEDVMDLRQIVLKPETVDPDRKVFRAKYFNAPIFVSRDLAGDIEGRGFSGIRFAEVAEYSGTK